MIQIKHRLTGKVLFEADKTLLRLVVEAAVETGADLWGADLRGAVFAPGWKLVPIDPPDRQETNHA